MSVFSENKKKKELSKVPAPIHGDIVERIAKGDVSIRRVSHPQSVSSSVADGVAVVMCHWGHDEKQCNSTRRGIDYMADSNPRPSEWVFVEAQEDGRFEFEKKCAELKIKYVRKDITEESKGIFVKEALWNIGAHATKSEKLVFVDADCVFINRAWACHVSKSLDNFDVGSPHGFGYYAEIDTSERTYYYNELFKSTGLEWSEREGRAKLGHPGFGLMMTREFYDELGGIPCASATCADSWFWYRLLGHWKRNYAWCVMPYNAPYVYNFGLRPFPKIGATHEVVAHIDHGAKGERHYLAQSMLSRWSTTKPFEDIVYDPMSDDLPVWADNPCGRIHRKARVEFMRRKSGTSNDEGLILARGIYDRHAEDVYGKIDDEHPLYIATSLRSGGQYTGEHVKVLQTLFARHCKTPHTFVCFSDIEIDGVKTIPLLSTRHQLPFFYVQNEIYRNVYPRNASVLTCDLDAIPVNDFTMHRCPEGEFAMGWEQHNWKDNMRCIWNGGMCYFNGDFSFIFDDVMSNPSERENMDMMFDFISSQEVMNGSLYKHGVHPVDLLRHLPFEFHDGDGKLKYATSAIVHFLGNVKPWNMKDKPSWLSEEAFNAGRN